MINDSISNTSELKEWETPSLSELDFNKTRGGANPQQYEDTTNTEGGS